MQMCLPSSSSIYLYAFVCTFSSIMPTLTCNCLLLCKYKEKVMDTNPDSYVETDSHEGCFVRLFVSYKSLGPKSAGREPSPPRYR